MSGSTIAIVGAGAIGGSVAAALGNAGQDVQLCVRKPFDQLKVELDRRTRTYSHQVLTEPTAVKPVDWLLLCTKAHQVAGAADWLTAMTREHTTVVVLQNGVEHESRVRDLLHTNARVLPCVVRLPATSISLGHTVQDKRGRLQVPRTAIGAAFARLFEGQSGIAVEETDDFISAAWDKLVRNAVSGLCAVIQGPMGILTDPEARNFVTGLIEEIKAVGEAEGAVFSPNLIDEFYTGYAGPTGQLWTSIAKDARDGRPMEWDARNAVIGRLGRKHGIDTPLNDALTTMLKLADRSL